MHGEQPPTSTDLCDSGQLTGTVRLLNHIRENNVSYLIGVLVAYQIGILDKLMTYGTGVC